MGSDVGYTIKETSILPEDWDVVRIGDLAKIRYGKANPKSNGNVPVVGSGGIFAWTDIPLIEYPTLVVGRKGTAGKVWLLECPSYPSDTAFYLEWKQKVDVQFLYGYLTLNPLSGEHAKTTLPSLARSDLENYLVPFPPLPEQRSIAHVLRTVQRAKEVTEKVIAATRQLKESLIRHLFTYGPVPFDQADRVELKETEVGLVQLDWSMASLNTIFKLSSGMSRPKDILESSDGDYRFPVFGGNGVLGYAKEYFMETETIVLGRVGEYCGAVHIAPPKSWISDNALFVKEFLAPIELRYLAMALELLDLNRFKKKSGQPLITQSIVYSQSIPLPGQDIQQQIVRLVTAVNHKLDAEEFRREALDALFKSLLHHLMTGKVRVKDLPTN
jgi:type I restriction enzyme S subunit